MRTSFDPEMELPKFQKWFQENPHLSRQHIQNYVVQLNALESRRGRKPLDVNNVVYWFKNARAAQKRAEMRGNVTTTMSALGHAAMNGYLSQHHGAQLGQNSSSSAGSQPSMSMGNLSGKSHDYLKSPMSLKSEDIDTMSQHSNDMDEEAPVSRSNTPQLPLSLTTHETNRNSPLMDGDEEHDDDEATAPTRAKSEISDVINGNVHRDERQQQQQQEKSNEEHKDDISKEHTEGGHNEQDHEQLPDDSALNHNNNENKLTTPKCRSTPKEEEDDLDMDDDDLEDNDNENDASHLDEFRSPSPAMDGNLVAASHKDQQLPFPWYPIRCSRNPSCT
ncbi:suppressor of Mek1-like [Drosophila willistoni]|uniref:suppressor of Mek1-like n=1 Tax=Drosophila willistoni TaxID=7260 RepID=UPI001F0863A4|nr:suppressor of Mek1-like [Drosophila willistoni]